MDEADVKTKFGTSSSNVKKVLKALLMEEMVAEMESPKRVPSTATPTSSSQKRDTVSGKDKTGSTPLKT